MRSDFRDIRMLERICILEWIKDSDLLDFLFWHFLRRPEKTCWSPGSPCPIPSPSSFPPAQGSKGHQSEESTKERSGYGLPRSKGTRGTPQIPAPALHLGLLHLCQSLCLSGKGKALVNLAWSRVWRSQVRSVPTLGLLEVGSAAQQLAPWICQDGPNVLIFFKKEIG